MGGHMSIANIVGEHQKEQGDLAVVKQYDIAPSVLIRNQNAVPNGLAQRFTAVWQITGAGIQRHFPVQLTLDMFQTVVVAWGASFLHSPVG
jgi:hypothetical protein